LSFTFYSFLPKSVSIIMKLILINLTNGGSQLKMNSIINQSWNIMSLSTLTIDNMSGLWALELASLPHWNIKDTIPHFETTRCACHKSLPKEINLDLTSQNTWSRIIYLHKTTYELSLGEKFNPHELNLDE
jgi:hypothetical protein